MHYYQKNIGDYRAATAHLSLLEHGVYNWLLDTYYSNEQPLPLDERVLFRLTLARSEDEKQAVRDVLDEFFTKTDTGWIQTRCDEEISKYHSKGDANRINGKKGGRPPKKEPTNNPTETQEEPTNNLNQEPITNNHKPRTKNQSHTGSHEILDAEPEDEKSMRDEPAEILNAESKAVGSPTLAGAICVALRANGAAANEVNPANPTLLKLISDGATIDHFVASFSKAKDAGAARPFLYMLTVVASELQAAAKIGNARASPSGLQQNKQEQLEKANALRAQSFIEKMEQQQRGTS